MSGVKIYVAGDPAIGVENKEDALFVMNGGEIEVTSEDFSYGILNDSLGTITLSGSALVTSTDNGIYNNGTWNFYGGRVRGISSAYTSSGVINLSGEYTFIKVITEESYEVAYISSYSAKIDETYYETVQDAINEAGLDSLTITIVRNTEEDVVVSLYQDLTLDGDSYTVNAVTVEPGARLQLVNTVVLDHVTVNSNETDESSINIEYSSIETFTNYGYGGSLSNSFVGTLNNNGSDLIVVESDIEVANIGGYIEFYSGSIITHFLGKVHCFFYKLHIKNNFFYILLFYLNFSYQFFVFSHIHSPFLGKCPLFMSLRHLHIIQNMLYYLIS